MGCWAAWQAALAGDFGPLASERTRAEQSPGPVAAAWSAAFSAAVWQAVPDREPPPDLDRIAGLEATTEAAVPIALACSVGELAATCAFDCDALSRWIEVHERLPQSSLSTCTLDVARGFASLMRGDTDRVVDAARELEARASSERLAHLVVDAASLAALAALESGDVDGATTLARRASRMARTEALPQHEYLAHVVLARLRRHTGRPHLATRILAALLRVAPPQWHGWLRWELLLAGGELVGEDVGPDTPALEASRHLERLLAAAGAGERAKLCDAHAAAHAALRGWPALAREVDDLVVAIDPHASTGEAPSDLASWLLADTDEIPGRLVGAASLGPRESAAWVAAWPEPSVPARRVLPVGTAFLGDARAIAGAGVRPGRTEKTVAVLLHAAEAGLENAVLFRAVYGFGFHPVLHRSVFDVLLHRVRTLLGDSADLLHRDEHVTLSLRAPVYVPDPRCERPVDDRLLRTLATSRSGTARETAEMLDLPLRTVQTALKQLVEEGVCVTEKRGRRVEYRVEDTTFSEPTLVS